ncbi:hypothetical protein AXA44_46920 [Rhodococcus sp. SC4]|nr:hypothetical protein AXA44_46920 [Rhodococcus sp. SC4]
MAASMATIARLEADLIEARTSVQSERTRAHAARDELATTETDLAIAQTQAKAAREPADELRTDLAEVRSASSTVADDGRK